MAIAHIATRKSPLAMRQAEMVRDWLGERAPGTGYDLLPLSTSGDDQPAWSLQREGGKGLFTQEIEAAVLDGRARLAAHSAKDLPTEDIDGLAIAGFLPRAKPHDVLVRHASVSIPETIATGSPRRRAQMEILFPEVQWTELRGNVGTRLRKIAEGEADATLLAAAGMARLGIEEHAGLTFRDLSVAESVPAPGQAAIAVQCRREDEPEFRALLCPETALAVRLERGFLRRLGGGCQTPVGAHYADGVFHAFHPKSGYGRVELGLASETEIETALDRVFEELQLAPES